MVKFRYITYILIISCNITSCKHEKNTASDSVEYSADCVHNFKVLII